MPQKPAGTIVGASRLAEQRPELGCRVGTLSGRQGEGEDLALKVVSLRVEPAVCRAHGDVVGVDDVEVVAHPKILAGIR